MQVVASENSTLVTSPAAEQLAAPLVFLDSALAYAARGWPVFPVHSISPSGLCTCSRPECEHPGKHPLTAHGFKDATTDGDQIREWSYLWPDANVAIATGEHSRLLVVDIDPRHGGYLSLAELERIHGPLPTTVTAISGSGGRHPYFSYPDTGATSRQSVLPGIDIRAAGGYIIAPPSLHKSGNLYTWAKGLAPGEIPIAPAPSWLLELIKKPRAAPERRVGGSTVLLERARRYAGSVEPAEEGVRNSTAFSLAGHLAAFRTEGGETMTNEEILEIVREWNRENSPPLSDIELQTTVTSGLENGKPREPKIVRAEEVETDTHLPEIEIRPGRLPQAADELERLLAEQDSGIFQRGGELVRVVAEPLKLSTGQAQARAKILPIEDTLLASLVARRCRFYRVGTEGKRLRIDPPAALLKDLLARCFDWKFRVLSHVTRAPVLLSDGRVITKPGYDADTGLYFDDQGVDWPSIPTEPTRTDAEAQLNVLRAFLGEFAFEAGVDESAALAMILTGCGRVAVGPVPLFAVAAPCQSSGKSTLASLASYIVDGHAPEAGTLGESEEECEKRILAWLRAGSRFVSLDNLDRPIKSAALCRVITEPSVTGRLLGVSSMSTQDTAGVLWTATGNNLEVVGDLPTRTLLIRLNTRVESTSEIEYRVKDLRQYAIDHRQELMAAALTIIRAYRVAGSPDVGLRANRFPGWGQVIASALMWLGLPDPLTRMRDAQKRDPDAESLATLLDAWDKKFECVPQTCADILLGAPNSPGLREALSVVASKPNGDFDPRRLGRFLSKVEDRIIDGRAFVRVGSGRVVKWSLRRMARKPKDGSAVGTAVADRPAQGIPADHSEGASSCLP